MGCGRSLDPGSCLQGRASSEATSATHWMSPGRPHELLPRHRPLQQPLHVRKVFSCHEVVRLLERLDQVELPASTAFLGMALESFSVTPEPSHHSRFCSPSSIDSRSHISLSDRYIILSTLPRASSLTPRLVPQQSQMLPPTREAIQFIELNS